MFIANDSYHLFIQNMFLAIINDTYSVVKVEIENSKNDVVLSDYFKVSKSEIINIKKCMIYFIQ